METPGAVNVAPEPALSEVEGSRRLSRGRLARARREPDQRPLRVTPSLRKPPR